VCLKTNTCYFQPVFSLKITTMSQWTTWCCSSPLSPYKQTQNLISRTSNTHQTGVETQSHNVNRWDNGVWGRGCGSRLASTRTREKRQAIQRHSHIRRQRMWYFKLWTQIVTYKHTIVYLDKRKPKATRGNCCVSALCLL